MFFCPTYRINPATGNDEPYYRIKESYRDKLGRVHSLVLLSPGFIKGYSGKELNLTSKALNKLMEHKGESATLFGDLLSEYPERVASLAREYWSQMEAKITAQNWSRFGTVSLDTAIRDIADLVEKGILSALPGRIRKVEYMINYVKADGFLKRFSDTRIEQGERGYYITADFDGTNVRERISDLDYKQHETGNITDEDLIHKYMAYLAADCLKIC